jgi:lactate dehydrogenase-like 2-hydroxyacid dehydrogenase
MTHKIVFLDSSTLGDTSNIDQIRELGEYIAYDFTEPEQTIERIHDCQIVITNKVVIDKMVMDACTDLRLICVAATGMNNIDLEYAAIKGIQVKNVAGYSTESVAQFTFALLFHLIHKLSYYDNYVKSEQYSNSHIFTHHRTPFFELKGKQFGIIGLGAIGSRVAAIADSFDARVVYYSTSGKNNNNHYRRISLSELVSTSDIITIHCPLNEQTLNLIGKEQFKLTKPNAIIINVSRGGIINESDLAMAIDSRLISGAALDVYRVEPIQIENPLLQIKRKEHILVTPHIAWTSVESRILLVEKIAENIKSYISSKN